MIPGGGLAEILLAQFRESTIQNCDVELLDLLQRLVAS